MVYSEADAQLLHFLEADNVYCIGPVPLTSESYVHVSSGQIQWCGIDLVTLVVHGQDYQSVSQEQGTSLSHTCLGQGEALMILSCMLGCPF